MPPTTYKFLPPTLADALGQLDLLVRRPVHGHQRGLHRSPHYGSSVEFAEYREYTRGDPTNLIDWSVYARSDRYVIRRFHEETNLRAYVMLDISASMGFRDAGPHSKLAHASYLAAGLLYVFLNQGDAASLVTFSGGLSHANDPVRTLEGLRPALLELEAQSPSGASNIEAALHDVAALAGGRSLIVLISDMLQPSAEILHGIRHLFHDGHCVMVLHVHDPSEMDLRFSGVNELRDMETEARLVVDIDEVRDAYRSALDKHLDALRRGCAECLVDYYLCSTTGSPAEQLRLLQERPVG